MVCRDTDFRPEYSCIAEIKVLIALTATASHQNKKIIMEKLCMDKDKCIVIEKPPNKPNIMYIVNKSPANDSIVKILLPIIQEIKGFGKDAPKTIMFCKTYSDLTDASSTLVYKLHSCDAFFLFASNGHHQPVYEMYTASTAEDIKDRILLEFTSLQSLIRVVVATIAFGMGLNAPDIRRCIHWGPSDTIQAYVQESGRCGRDNNDCVSILYFRNGDLSQASKVSDSMKLYCENTKIYAEEIY